MASYNTSDGQSNGPIDSSVPKLIVAARFVSAIQIGLGWDVSSVVNLWSCSMAQRPSRPGVEI